MARAKKKPDTVVDDGHDQLIKWVNESDDVGDDARLLSEKARNYYDSEQLTPDEIATLKTRRQAPVVINRIKPKMDALMGMEKAAKTTAKAFPRTPAHEGGAEACTEGIRFVLQDNMWDQVRSAAWENLLIEGSCGCEVIVKPNKGEGYKVILRYLMWDRLIWDAHSRRKDFSDARWLGQVVWMDYDEAVALYPEAKDVLETMTSNSSTYDDKPRWMDGNRRRVKIVEMYYRKANGEMWYACFTRGGYCSAPKKSPYIDEEGYTEWPYEFASCFVTREGGRYGAVRQLTDVQDEINARRSKALHLMSVRQVRGERGAVDDVNKARQELAKPDGYIETTPGMEFEVLKTGDMAAAQFNLLTEAKNEIDAVGANAAVQGKGNSGESGIAMRTRQQAGQVEIGPMFDVLRYWQLRVFRKIWNRIRQYWKVEMWIRVTDDETKLRWVGLNRAMTAGEQLLERAKQQNLPPEQMQELQQRIAQDPAMQKKVKHNEVAELDMDIIISEVPDVLTAQIEDFQTLGEMVKSGFPIPPMAVILASPLSNKDQIIKMMKEQPQLPPQVQEQMKQAHDAAVKLQQENQKLQQENQQLKASTALDTQKFNEQHQLKVAEAHDAHQARLQEIDRNAEATLKKARIDAAVKVTVAQIGAKSTLTATEIQAEADANVELAGLFHDRAKHTESLKADQAMHSEGLQADQTMHSAGIESDQTMHEGDLEAQAAQATAEAKKPANTPIAKMTQMHEKSSQDMAGMAAAMKDMAAAIAKLAEKQATPAAPEKARTITLVKKNGETVGATVQ